MKYGLPPQLDIGTKDEMKVRYVLNEKRRAYYGTWGIIG
jgi:hypothetical protein